MGGAMLLAVLYRIPGLQSALQGHDWSRFGLELLPAAFVAVLVPGYLLVRAVMPPAGGAIYATAVLFAIGHAKVWPSPVPLFFFALALGGAPLSHPKPGAVHHRPCAVQRPGVGASAPQAESVASAIVGHARLALATGEMSLQPAKRSSTDSRWPLLNPVIRFPRSEAPFDHLALYVEIHTDRLVPIKPGEAGIAQTSSGKLLKVGWSEKIEHLLCGHAELHLLILLVEGSTRPPGDVPSRHNGKTKSGQKRQAGRDPPAADFRPIQRHPKNDGEDKRRAGAQPPQTHLRPIHSRDIHSAGA